MLDSGAGIASSVSSALAAGDDGSNGRGLKLFMGYSAFSELDQRFDVVAANPLHRARREAQQLQFLEFGARMMDGTLGAKKNLVRSKALRRLVNGREGPDRGFQEEIVIAAGETNCRCIGPSEPHMAEDERQPRICAQERLESVKRCITGRDDMRIQRLLESLGKRTQHLHAAIGKRHAIDERAEFESAESIGNRAFEIGLIVERRIDMKERGELPRELAYRVQHKLIGWVLGDQRLASAKKVGHAKGRNHSAWHENRDVHPRFVHARKGALTSFARWHEVTVCINNHCASLRSRWRRRRRCEAGKSSQR